MKVILNGEAYNTDALFINGLLDELKIASGRVAVEVNLRIIKKTEFDSLKLCEGDSIEIVNFVGGGN